MICLGLGGGGGGGLSWEKVSFARRKIRMKSLKETQSGRV